MSNPPLGSPDLSDRKRLISVAVFIFVLFSLLIIQFYRIQIVEGEKWAKKAQAQHQFIVKDPGKRGLFYSNTSVKLGHPEYPQPLVIDVPKFHLYIDPEAIPERLRDYMSEQVAKFLKIHDNQKEKRMLREQFDKKLRSRKVAVWLEKELKETIEEWWRPFSSKNKIPRNALFFIEDYKRSYPFGKLLGQVLHTVRDDKDQLTGQNIPTGGLELVFNSYLQGKEGKRVLLRSPRHAMDIGKVLASPENGADVYLTINHYIQAIAEEEVEKAVKRSEAKGGWAVMMDPATGEVLALAQYPFFHPSDYAHYFNDPSLLEETKVKAVTNAYEPGSTFKPITMVLALQANVEQKKNGKKPIFDPKEKMAVADGRFPGRSKPITDIKKTRYHNMQTAIQKSSNIYVARLAQRMVDNLGEAWYRGILCEGLGFGKKTGIELPSESGGLVPTPGKKHKSGHLEWSVPTPFSLAMGYNIQVNSIHMLKAYSAIANGGIEVNPTLVRKIVKNRSDGTQEILLDNTDEKRVNSFRRILDPSIIKEIIPAMKYTTKPGGTASKGDIYGYTEVGKTGTSEKIVNGQYCKSTNFSTFIGFAPAKDARFVLLVAIDEPKVQFIPGIGKMQMGGNCAAPCFREIATRTLRYLGVTPDDPYGYPPGDPRYDPKKADWLEKSKELTELYRQWNEA